MRIRRFILPAAIATGLGASVLTIRSLWLSLRPTGTGELEATLAFSALIAVVCAAGAIGLAILFYLRSRRAEAEQQRVRVETLNAVMATVMDSQNNFLNNVLYFRTRAEGGAPMDPMELHQLDEAIRDARLRLIQIAETESFETRDLGGVAVLPQPRRADPARRLAG